MGTTKTKMRICLTTAALSVWLGACGEEKKPEDEGCKPTDAASCEDGLVCEQIGESGETFECLPPVIVSGRVFDALDESAIAEATVVGLDANGAARTRVSRTNADGSYELPVSMRRREDGAPLAEQITLRVAASDHQPFPVAPRSALPIQLGEAQKQDAGADDKLPIYRFESAATDVALLPLPAEEQGRAVVTGRIDAAQPGGVLVVAGSGEASSASAISDLDGAFVLFNVPEGATTLEGYRAGLAVEPRALEVPAKGLEDVVLVGSTAELAKVTGSINIVNAPGGSQSSVILVVASTFDPDAVRGETPAGLRAGNVSSAFSIEDVPPGRYAVLAAFENDKLVRDPDTNIAGTEVVFVDVPKSGGSVTLDQSFKVTEALHIVAPGADGIEKVKAGPLTLSWQDDSSEDGYELRVYDAFGDLVKEETALPSVTGSASVSYELDASGFKPGMLYQFRVRSFREPKGMRSYISASEDLKGVFEIAH